MGDDERELTLEEQAIVLVDFVQHIDEARAVAATIEMFTAITDTARAQLATLTAERDGLKQRENIIVNAAFAIVRGASDMDIVAVDDACDRLLATLEKLEYLEPAPAEPQRPPGVVPCKRCDGRGVAESVAFGPETCWECEGTGVQPVEAR